VFFFLAFYFNYQARDVYESSKVSAFAEDHQKGQRYHRQFSTPKQNRTN
jgi:hypothetical protein